MEYVEASIFVTEVQPNSPLVKEHLSKKIYYLEIS